MLREIRFAINEFRDDRVDGLIRSRNRLLWVVLTVGITAYLALALALLNGIGEIQVGTIAVLYLVGCPGGSAQPAAHRVVADRRRSRTSGSTWPASLRPRCSRGWRASPACTSSRRRPSC